MRARSSSFRLALGALFACGAIWAALLAVGAEAQDADKKTEPTQSKSDSAEAKASERAGEAELSARIDRELGEVWKAEGIRPAPLTTDEEFVRRVYLDTVGAAPTWKETREFLDDESKDKREKLIDRLVDDPRFGERLSDLWSAYLLGRDMREKGMSHLFALWLADRINQGAGFDDVIYDLISARGRLSENPAVALWVTFGNNNRPSNYAGVVTQKLTGVQIQCAQCHDHPYEGLRQKDFAGVASFFAPVAVRIDSKQRPVDPVVFDQPVPPKRLIEGFQKGDIPFDTQRLVKELLAYDKPVALDGFTLRTSDRTFWRSAYAKWVIDPKNTQTSRYIVNRFWSYAFGYGFVNPADNFTSSNLPSHPELLSALAEDFVAHDWDVKRLWRVMLKSSAWQLSSREADKKASPSHFASYPVRQLDPEQFFGSLIVVGGGDRLTQSREVQRLRKDPFERVRNQARRAEREKEREAEGKGKSAGDKNERDVVFDLDKLDRMEEEFARMSDQWFLRRSFGADWAQLGDTASAPAGSEYALSIDQALADMNSIVGTYVSSSNRGTLVHELLSTYHENDDRVQTLWLTVYSREPDEEELKEALEFIEEIGHAGTALEDLLYAMLNSAEFVTNH